MGVLIMTTATEFRAQAQAARQSAADSWERSDTDGFVSQWASGLTAREYDLKADLAERGDVDAFYDSVMDADGNVAPARVVETRYGSKVAIFASWEDADTYGAPVKAWASPTDRALRKYGLRMAWRTAPAKVVYTGSGKGLAGAMSVGLAVVPTTKPSRTDVLRLTEEES
jgi:hypothetical protein